MEFTKKFLRAKSPCADGFRWFVRNVEDGSGYQDALDTLVGAGRVDDACWLLTQFGPTNEVMRVDALGAEAIVFAGTIEVRGSIDVDTVLQAGRSIRAGGGVRAGRAIVAGEAYGSRAVSTAMARSRPAVMSGPIGASMSRSPFFAAEMSALPGI